MAILSTRQAQRLGRLGGKEGARLGGRFGNSEWGRTMQRKRAAKAQRVHYPTLHKEWAGNANRPRWGRTLAPVSLVDTPAAVGTREARRLRKRRDRYERARARAVPLPTFVAPAPSFLVL